MKPQKSPAAILILFALGFIFLNLTGNISAVQAQVQVTAADPPSATQGTINLNVKITGKGFKKGAVAKWFVTGTTDPGGVTVNSTAFVDSGELTANIDVADTATIANFDIAVTDPDGRGGKGTELFAVTSNSARSANTCTVQPLPAGISLLATFNYVNTCAGCTGAHYGPALGTTVRARQMILNGAPVLIVGVSSSPSVDPKLEIFFVDSLSGQVLDGNIIGSGAAVQPHITVAGPQGRSLAVGDVNGDGIPDFVAGMGANAVVGSISGGVVSYQNFVLPMPASATGAGWGVAMGDLNGTGSDVIAIGAVGGGSGNGPTALGEVSLFSFNGSGFTNTQNIVSPMPNPKKDESFGKGVAIADVTGTGAKDLIVGAPTSIVNGVNGAGRVFVFPGPVSASSYLTFTTGLKSDNFGNKVASGDVNGDFLGDLLATTWNGDTKAQVYDGLVSQGESPNFVLRPISGLSLGWSTTEPDMSDVNGDGLADVLIGAPNAASGSICGGAAYLYLSGGPGFPLATRLMLNTPVVETSSSPFQVFGWATAFAPGTRLFFVSDHGLDLGSTTNAGQVYVYKVN